MGVRNSLKGEDENSKWIFLVRVGLVLLLSYVVILGLGR